MIKSTRERQRAVSSALGSVRAEGLQPSKKTHDRLQHYANGTMSAYQVRQITIAEMQSSAIKPRHNN